MNILVTGCMGFIGSNLVPFLLNQGHKVVGFDNLSKPSINPTDRMKSKSFGVWQNFKFYRVDICNQDEMLTILANEQVECVIHLAAVGSVPLSFLKPDYTYKTNVYGFSVMMDVSRKLGIKKFIFASSSSVYGSSKTDLRREGHEGKPLSPYALSKKMNEEHAIIWSPYDMQFIGLRFFNVYGPGQSLNGYYSAVIPRFLTEAKPEVYGDGETIRDFTYVDDVCDAILKSLHVDGSAIVNIGTGVGTSLNQLLEKTGKTLDAQYKDQRPGDVQKSIADIEYAHKKLNFVYKTSIDDGLKETKKFYETYMAETGTTNA